MGWQEGIHSGYQRKPQSFLSRAKNRGINQAVLGRLTLLAGAEIVTGRSNRADLEKLSLGTATRLACLPPSSGFESDRTSPEQVPEKDGHAFRGRLG